MNADDLFTLATLAGDTEPCPAPVTKPTATPWPRLTDCPACVQYEGSVGRCVEHAAPVPAIDWPALDASPLADRLFDVTFRDGHADGLVYQLCNELLGDDYEGWSYDYYDRSLEVYGVADQASLTAVQASRLWALGFDRAWLNHVDGTQTAYWKGNGAGHHSERSHRANRHDEREVVRLRANLEVSRRESALAVKQVAALKAALDAIGNILDAQVFVGEEHVEHAIADHDGAAIGYRHLAAQFRAVEAVLTRLADQGEPRTWGVWIESDYEGFAPQWATWSEYPPRPREAMTRAEAEERAARYNNGNCWRARILPYADDRRIDTIYKTIDDLLLAGRFADADAILDGLDVDALPPVDRLAYLTITLPAREQLARRAAYAEWVRRSLERDDPENAAALMAGLIGERR